MSVPSTQCSSVFLFDPDRKMCLTS
uniref:Uncharacterized protein n=1 Tax=Anguilla anguilla TaxID=7936 RepID=A0A0E9UBY5_ANGAN